MKNLFLIYLFWFYLRVNPCLSSKDTQTSPNVFFFKKWKTIPQENSRRTSRFSSRVYEFAKATHISSDQSLIRGVAPTRVQEEVEVEEKASPPSRYRDRFASIVVESLSNFVFSDAAEGGVKVVGRISRGKTFYEAIARTKITGQITGTIFRTLFSFHFVWGGRGRPNRLVIVGYLSNLGSSGLTRYIILSEGIPRNCYRAWGC